MVCHQPSRAVAIAIGTLLIAGCRIEETPAEYIDHQDSIEQERATAGAEVRDRLLAFGGGVARGDAAEALIALNPASDVRIVLPDGELTLEGEAGARAMIARLAGTAVAVRIREVDVRTGGAATVAWFSLLMEAPGATPEPSLYRATGTYLRDAGLWELVQAHISGPLTPQPPPSPSDSADTPAGDE